MKQDSNQLKAGIVLNYVNMILGSDALPAGTE